MNTWIFFNVFLKNRNIISKIKRSNVTDYAAFTLYFIETHFNAFTNRADPALWSGSTLFAYGNMVRYDPTLVDPLSNFFGLCTNAKVEFYNYSLLVELNMNIHEREGW